MGRLPPDVDREPARPLLLMRDLCGHMRVAQYGHVVNVTSIHARFTGPGSLAYDVSKAGLEAATRTAAIELAPDGVFVNAAAPGFVSTRMSLVDGVDELKSDYSQNIYVRNGRLPLRRAAEPAEVAETITLLASPGKCLRHRASTNRRRRTHRTLLRYPGSPDSCI